MKLASGSVTIDDVARHVGVAKGTVSRVLNNYTDISLDTRERVLKAIDELGYRPSSTARNLKRGRVDTVGLVLPYHDGNFADPFLAEFLDGISRALSEQDKDLLVATTSSQEDTLSAYERMIAMRKVDGFIVTRTEADDARVNFLLEKGFPFVTHGRTNRETEHAWFDIDNEGAFVSAVKHVVELGHTRIAYVGGSNSFNFARQRLAGYKNGLAEQGLPVDDDLIVITQLTELGGEEAVNPLLSLPQPPTAILCMTDQLGIGAINCARKAGLKIGSDLSVISYDGLPVGAHLDVPLTTFEQHTQEAGKKLAGILSALSSGEPLGSQQVLAQADLVPRDSDGAPARTSQELAQLLART